MWLLVVLYILISLSLCPVFAKAYIPQYYAFVPIVREFYLLKMIEKQWWWLLLLCIPIVNAFVWIYFSILLSRAFDKNILYAVGLVFLAPIFFAVLGLGDSLYCGGYRYSS